MKGAESIPIVLAGSSWSANIGVKGKPFVDVSGTVDADEALRAFLQVPAGALDKALVYWLSQ